MLQSIIIGILSLAALCYLGWLVYRSFTSSACDTGCGKCGTLDIKSIMKSVEEKKGTA